MTDEVDHPQLSERGQRVLDVLHAGAPEMPVVVVARLTGIPPTKLSGVLDELHDAGLVLPGSERATVRLVPRDEKGRFDRGPSLPGQVRL